MSSTFVTAHFSVPVCRAQELLSAHMQNCFKCSVQVGFASLYEVTELGGGIAYPSDTL